MTLEGASQALLQLEGRRPWRLERVADASAAVLATSLPERDYPEEIRSLQRQLSAMVEKEQAARLAFDQKSTEALDATNRPVVGGIFEKFGWVTRSLGGKDASHNFWLLVQHQTPEIQQRMLPALEKAAKAGDASMSHYAYLYDRVQVGLGKPQHWGTQTRCENGKPVLAPVDDQAGLEARRKELFLMPVRKYLEAEYLVKSCAK